MDTRKLLDFMSVAEKLKCRTRHSWTSEGRRESVAEHTYRLMVFAWLVRDEFPECDMERVMKLCLFHDLGEAVTGDIPCFRKHMEDEDVEKRALCDVAARLPKKCREELFGIIGEIWEKQTKESKLLQALDKMEAVIQHNEAPIDTWIPLEYKLQLTYGAEQAEVFPYMKELRNIIRQDTLEKIQKEGNQAEGNEDGFFVSCDRGFLDAGRVEELMRQTYWASGRSKEEIREAMEGASACFSVCRSDGYMVGYARVITDNATVFYLCDVVIDEEYRRQGLGTMLMERIMEKYGYLHGILHTEDAREFYARYGFEPKYEQEETLMEKPRGSR